MAQDDRQTSLEDTLEKIREIAAILEGQKVERLDPLEVGSTSKLVFKTLVARQSLLWRAVELAHGSHSSIEHENLLSACILTRSLIETSAVQGSLNRIVETASQSNSWEKIDQGIMSILLANRTGFNEGQFNSTNILNHLDKVEKRLPGIRRHYDDLSEVTHPKWSGTLGLFSAPVDNEIYTDFGRYIAADIQFEEQVASDLLAASTLFSFDFVEFGSEFDAFVEACESLEVNLDGK